MPVIPNINKGVVFSVKGPFAHFRKFYSQTSAMSYSIPPRTAISGIIGAILGIPREKAYELMQPPNGYICLQVVNPVRKITSTANLLSTKKDFLSDLFKRSRLEYFDSTENRTQIPMEVLIPQPPNSNLKFRVAFWHNDENRLRKLANYLQNKNSFYPIYLGISEFLATVEFEGITESAVELTGYEGEIHSVVVGKMIDNVLVKPGTNFNVEYMLIYMNNDFSAKSHANVIYSKNPIYLKTKVAIKWKNWTWVPYELM